jgi:uncharacterized pyridoxal phosphate-containing UPF0001 family protein
MPLPSDHPIAAALADIRARIQSAARAAGRDPASVTLVAVSKTHAANAVNQALQAGQTVFGENRVQEAAEKFPPLRAAHPDLRLHLIGALQTNKAEDAVARAADRAGRLPNLLVQVNIGGEPQKAGVAPAEAAAFIDSCRKQFGNALTGLMCIPPVDQDPTPHFRALAKLAQDYGLATLSMGMSSDFEAAIACGATHVRVGSAIFGRREPTGGS